MTRQLPESVRPIGDYLVDQAGLYLRNVVHAPGSTCDVCATPLNHTLDRVCSTCARHEASGLPLADRVASLVYAAYDTQAYEVVRRYKSDLPGEDALRVMAMLLALGLRGHIDCDLAQAGVSTCGWCVVPSSKGGTTLGGLVRGLARRPELEVRLSVSDSYQKRVLRPDNFLIESATTLPEHVLVIDDSWVSGANAQSAAVALKTAGVRDVSVLTVSRVLNPGFDATKRFLRAAGPLVFDPNICPWTDGACP